ncbi:PREDICTED: uncharacterized protein LOC108565480 [Nicrophorus vespilloides]|uniref:hydroxyisourate hydrolase n=1 Tax=Nicrophorus vespilloides TaxID=110193 RepID=A0ABM1N0X2_NICVS|nr:PREDICTED: uncharacterized protein LOC108565480 [Nicrophorus vespilloides]
MESEGDDETNSSQNIVIGGDYDEFEHIEENVIEARSVQNPKARYYKQTYRAAWEHMPDFKGWLRGVQGEPTRAYCVYCQKTLHAHRLSLLKHTCTIRHQKAAQLHNSRKLKAHNIITEEMSAYTITETEKGEEFEEEMEESEAMVQYVSEQITEENEEQETEEPEEEEEIMEAVTLPVKVQYVKTSDVKNAIAASNMNKPPISTHVLDTTKGCPVSGLQVSLYKLIDGRWTYINEGTTNPDGRCCNFIESGSFSIGRYKLHFDVDRYFESREQTSLYPFIEIVFDCRSPEELYHIPLLLNPYGYTTYRGT